MWFKNRRVFKKIFLILNLNKKKTTHNSSNVGRREIKRRGQGVVSMKRFMWHAHNYRFREEYSLRKRGRGRKCQHDSLWQESGMGLTTRIQWKPHLHVQINTCNFNESKFEKNASKIYSQQIKILTLIPWAPHANQSDSIKWLGGVMWVWSIGGVHIASTEGARLTGFENDHWRSSS